jgi:hypothetical protein
VGDLARFNNLPGVTRRKYFPVMPGDRLSIPTEAGPAATRIYVASPEPPNHHEHILFPSTTALIAPIGMHCA